MPLRGLARTITHPPISTAWRDPSTNGLLAWVSSFSTGLWAVGPTIGRLDLYRNTTPIFPWLGKPGYNLTTDLADEAIKYMSSLNAAAPDQPFFVYYVPGGTHSPHQPTKEWIAKFRGKFDMGWEKLRDQIFANQKKKLGVIPETTQLTPWPDVLPAVGQAFDGAKETLCARGRGICCLRGLYRQ